MMNVIPLEDLPMHTIGDHKENSTLKECIQRGYVIRRFPKEDTVHLFAAVETKMGKTVPVGYYVEVAGTHETEVSLKLKKIHNVHGDLFCIANTWIAFRLLSHTKFKELLHPTTFCKTTYGRRYC